MKKKIVIRTVILSFVLLILSMIFIIALYKDRGKYSKRVINDFSIGAFTGYEYNEETNELISKNKDPNWNLAGFNQMVNAVEVDISDTKISDFNIQIYYDIGNGYNEYDMGSIAGKTGKNLIAIKNPGMVYNLRFDLTDQKNHTMKIDSITINPHREIQLRYIIAALFIINLIIILLSIGFQKKYFFFFTIASTFSLYMIRNISRLQNNNAVRANLIIVGLDFLFIIVMYFLFKSVSQKNSEDNAVHENKENKL